ncbi:MAG: outer membrane beta-barrel protein [Cyclobacteriaceae bacterium]
MRTVILAFIAISIFKPLGSLCQSAFKHGSITTSDGVKINGQLQVRSDVKNYESCIFKSSEGEKKYFPTEISGFAYQGDKSFVSGVLPDLFVEVLVLGDLSLYRYGEKYILKKQENVHILLSTPKRVDERNKIGHYVEDNKWKGVVSFLISDCIDNLGQVINKVKLDERSLTKLVVSYNSCQGSEFVEIKKDLKWTEFKLGVGAGIIRSSLHTQNKKGDYIYIKDSYTSIDPTIGFTIKISSPRINENISLDIESYFINAHFSSLTEINGVFTEYHRTHIRMQTISFPVSVNYIVPKNGFKISLSGGVNFDYHVQAETRRLSERVEKKIVTTYQETEAFAIKKNQLGYWIGVGAIKAVKRVDCGISFRYHLMPELNEGIGLSAHNTRFSFNVNLTKK